MNADRRLDAPPGLLEVRTHLIIHSSLQLRYIPSFRLLISIRDLLALSLDRTSLPWRARPSRLPGLLPPPRTVHQVDYPARPHLDSFIALELSRLVTLSPRPPSSKFFGRHALVVGVARPPFPPPPLLPPRRSSSHRPTPCSDLAIVLDNIADAPPSMKQDMELVGDVSSTLAELKVRASFF